MKKIFITFCFLLFFCVFSVNLKAQSSNHGKFLFLFSGNVATYHELCKKAIYDAEQQYQIPKGILQSIANIESGYSPKIEMVNKGDNQREFAWPWTINNGGKSYYFQTKDEAVNKVYSLLHDGEKNIDVGCMQINLKWHGHAFKKIEEAFKPLLNAAYAAKFLKSLYEKHESWEEAIGYYHSSYVVKNQRYKKKVLEEYNRIILKEQASKENIRENQDFNLDKASLKRNKKLKKGAYIDLFSTDNNHKKQKILKDKKPLLTLFMSTP